MSHGPPFSEMFLGYPLVIFAKLIVLCRNVQAASIGGKPTPYKQIAQLVFLYQLPQREQLDSKDGSAKSLTSPVSSLITVITVVSNDKLSGHLCITFSPPFRMWAPNLTTENKLPVQGGNTCTLTRNLINDK